MWDSNIGSDMSLLLPIHSKVAGVVKACEKIEARRASREEKFKEIADDLNDEGKYGMPGVLFRRIVDFERRFGRLTR